MYIMTIQADNYNDYLNTRKYYYFSEVTNTAI